MKKVIILVVILILIATAIIFFANLAKKAQTSQTIDQTAQKTAEKIIKDEALKNALNLYAQKKAEGADFGSGPCLGTIAPDWVLDIAHSPRQPVDNQPENQCEDFRAGRAHHFVELDPEGKLIQIF